MTASRLRILMRYIRETANLAIQFSVLGDPRQNLWYNYLRQAEERLACLIDEHDAADDPQLEDKQRGPTSPTSTKSGKRSLMRA